MSLTSGANLPPVSTTLAKLVGGAGVNDTGGNFAADVIDIGGKFTTGVVDTGGAHISKYLRIFSKKFETFLTGYSGAGGETDS